MISRLFLLALLPALCSCSIPGPPRLAVGSCVDLADCESIYPQGHWQFVHLIEFQLPNGTGGTVIGITVIEGNAVQCALTTTEGMTLFEAEDGDTLKILQAVPPFDKPGFAEGLMADVRAIFLQPPGAPVCGALADERRTCRFRQQDGKLTDILPEPDARKCFRIITWSADHRQTRIITAKDCRQQDGYRQARSLTLNSSGIKNYTLKMSLINAEQLSPPRE